MPKSAEVESRLNVLLKLIGSLFLIFGAALAALTATSPIIPQVASVFYFISITMIVSGFLAVYAKLK